jgi:hypothetical protein
MAPTPNIRLQEEIERLQTEATSEIERNTLPSLFDSARWELFGFWFSAAGFLFQSGATATQHLQAGFVCAVLLLFTVSAAYLGYLSQRYGARRKKCETAFLASHRADLLQQLREAVLQGRIVFLRSPAVGVGQSANLQHFQTPYYRLWFEFPQPGSLVIERASPLGRILTSDLKIVRCLVLMVVSMVLMETVFLYFALY